MKNKFTVLSMGVFAFSMILAAQGPPPPGGFGRGPGGPGGRGPGGRGPGGPGFGGPQATVAGAPYSGVQTHDSTQTLANGTQIAHNDSSKVYRDSQGRVRTEVTMTPPPGSTAQARTMITIFDPVAGTISRIDPQQMTVDTSTIRTGGPARGPAPTNSTDPNVVTLDLGTKTINGLTATGTRITRTIPAGTMGNSQTIQSVHEIWISTDLKVPVLITDTDPRSGTHTMQLTSVVRSEPAASLFVAPSNYTVTSHARPAGPPR